ncbi:MAG: radical SAM protein [Spirochaetota bacterium]
MKTIHDIRAVIYDPAHMNEYTERFMNIPGCEYLAVTGEDKRSEMIDYCRKKYRSKEVIILKSFKGRLFQMCPGSPGMICCNYRLVNTGFNCLYNCAYCYLQLYLNAYGIVLFTNMEDVYREIAVFLEDRREDPDMIYRIGTGEFTDSLMIDDVAGVGCRLVSLCSEYPNVMIELKTKSNQIDHLLSVPKKGNAVIGWSVNTPYNVAKYEEGSASLEERLAAARKAAESGYAVAFHFDPIIIHDGWKEAYGSVIDRIFGVLPDDAIAWISLGTYRYVPQFKDVVRNNFPEEKMSAGEFFACEDGKHRYVWNLRAAIYCFIKERIRSHSAKPYIYMCMESRRMWKYVYGIDFADSDQFERHFSAHMKEWLASRASDDGSNIS